MLKTSMYKWCWVIWALNAWLSSLWLLSSPQSFYHCFLNHHCNYHCYQNDSNINVISMILAIKVIAIYYTAIIILVIFNRQTQKITWQFIDIPIKFLSPREKSSINTVLSLLSNKKLAFGKVKMFLEICFCNKSHMVMQTLNFKKCRKIIAKRWRHPKNM